MSRGLAALLVGLGWAFAILIVAFIFAALMHVVPALYWFWMVLNGLSGGTIGWFVPDVYRYLRT